MAALLIVLLTVVMVGALSALNTGLPRAVHRRRQTIRNRERQAIAASRGWYFSPNAPELVNRWIAAPFLQRGDRRLVYGVISGTHNGARFTVFDFQLRTHIMVVNGVHSESNAVHTVWVIHLPAVLPSLMVVPRGFARRQDASEVRGLHPEFSKQYAVYSRNPWFAVELLTPAAMQMIASHAREGFVLQGSDLVYARKATVDLGWTVDMLRALVAAFPPHIWHQRQN